MDRDEDQRRPLRSAVRRFLLPFGKLRNIKRFGRHNPEYRVRLRDVGSSAGFVLSALKKRKGSACPLCHAPKGASLVEAVDQQAGGVVYFLGCERCDYVENIEFQLEEVAATIDSLRLGEKRFLLAAAGAVLFGFAYYFATGLIITLIAAMLIATMILTNALVFRYRVWQIVHRRLYEKNAPIRDWLRHEFS